MNTSLSSILFLALAAVAACSGQLQLTDNSNDEFADFLVETMQGYGSWLTDNGLDPSPIISDTVVFPRGNLNYTADLGQINCTIRDQQVSGHSNTSLSIYEAESNFTGHFFLISQNAKNLRFTYQFDCSGTIKAAAAKSASLVYQPFNGHGNFTLNLDGLVGNETFLNFGITPNLGLDFNSSWSRYRWRSISYLPSEIWADWDNSEIMKYIGHVKNYLISYHKSHMENDGSQLNPERKLLVRYLLETLSNVNLRDIISEDLPPPYTATPTDGTATTPRPPETTIVTTQTPSTPPTQTTSPQPPTTPSTTTVRPTSSKPLPVANFFFSCTNCTNYFNFTILRNMLDNLGITL